MRLKFSAYLLIKHLSGSMKNNKKATEIIQWPFYFMM